MECGDILLEDLRLRSISHHSAVKEMSSTFSIGQITFLVILLSA